MKKKNSPLISVIIPARNEEKYILETLDSLKKQTFQNFETILVANACTDKTATIAKSHCTKTIITKTPGQSNARNLGARAARGDLFVFLDADTLLTRNALQEISNKFTNEYSIGTLNGKPDKFCLTGFLLYFYKNLAHSLGIYHGTSGIIITRNAVFKKTGGFEKGLDVREIKNYVAKAMQYGKYKYISDAKAITSMRRFNVRFGFLKNVSFWLEVWFKSWSIDKLKKQKYKLIR